MFSIRAWADAQWLWKFQQMGYEPRPRSVAIALGSHNLGVGDITVDLHWRGMMSRIILAKGYSEGNAVAEHVSSRPLIRPVAIMRRRTLLPG